MTLHIWGVFFGFCLKNASSCLRLFSDWDTAVEKLEKLTSSQQTENWKNEKPKKTEQTASRRKPEENPKKTRREKATENQNAAKERI